MTIPQDVIKILETEIDGIEYGEAVLTIFRRGQNTRYAIGRERSFLENTIQKGVDEPYLKNGENRLDIY
jgi:hypothetical protein